jgi:transcription elongation factor S-II
VGKDSEDRWVFIIQKKMFTRKDCIELRNQTFHSVFFPLFAEMARPVEMAVHNFTCRELKTHHRIQKYGNDYYWMYKDRARSLFRNFQSNPFFLDSVRQLSSATEWGTFLETCTHIDMDSDQWKDQLEKKSKRDYARFHEEEQASTDMYICPKCRSRKATFYTLQIRSADEPETVFVTCLDCKHNFRR